MKVNKHKPLHPQQDFNQCHDNWKRKRKKKKKWNTKHGSITRTYVHTQERYVDCILNSLTNTLIV